MNSLRTLRHLDRWLGVPLCFFASLGLRLAALLRAPRTAPDAGAVLYVALAEMGSIVLAAPAIRTAARARGTAPVFVTLAQTRAVFDFLGDEFAADVHVLRTDSVVALCADLWRFALAMRRRGLSAAIDLDPGARFSALLTLLSGAPRRVGFAGAALPYRGRLYSDAVDCPADRHMSENFAALVAAPFPHAGGDDAGTPPTSSEPPSSLAGARLRRRLPQLERRRIVLVHANCSDAVPQRRWPRQRYVELCRRLLDETPDLALLFIGGAAEAPAAAELCAELGDARCMSVAGDVAIADLPALFAMATLFVGSDSGPAHFAAHAGLPVVVLFGPETPQRYRPLGDTAALHAGLPCSPCLSPRSQRASRCRDARCMDAITVDAVLDALRARLRSPHRERAARA